MIVEDDLSIAEIERDYLQANQYEVDIAAHGKDGVNLARENDYDLILLDIMLPDIDGFTVCREIRALKQTPILFVTARMDDIDKIKGFAAGADDYICKPFSPREVVARVKAVLRRGGERNPKEYGLTFDKEKYKATLHGKDLDLTVFEFQMLYLLAARPGQIFSREKLMERIYPDHRVVSDRTIDSHVKKLRRKIETAAKPGEEWIHSVYGAGYKFEAP